MLKNIMKFEKWIQRRFSLCSLSFSKLYSTTILALSTEFDLIYQFETKDGRRTPATTAAAWRDAPNARAVVLLLDNVRILRSVWAIRCNRPLRTGQVETTGTKA